ncbi:unnamed protein product [marine sediment metagenome]|uniref:Uncharacterized protein n=1 Tax=marine sediment metagenome TaxID=412755 RepID=X0XQA6_9ZZZZ
MENEREESVIKFDIELSKEDFEMYRAIGIQRIQSDGQALVEYAMVKLLEDTIKGLDLGEENGTES